MVLYFSNWPLFVSLHEFMIPSTLKMYFHFCPPGLTRFCSNIWRGFAQRITTERVLNRIPTGLWRGAHWGRGRYDVMDEWPSHHGPPFTSGKSARERKITDVTCAGRRDTRETHKGSARARRHKQWAPGAVTRTSDTRCKREEHIQICTCVNSHIVKL